MISSVFSSFLMVHLTSLFLLFNTTPPNTVNSPAVSPLTIYFKKPTTWANARIHYWNPTPAGAVANTTWPGDQMTLMQTSCDWYVYTFPATVTSINIVFTSGSSGPQTGNLSRSADGYYDLTTGWSNTPPAGYCGNPPPFCNASPSGPYNSLNSFVVTLNIYDNSDPNPSIFYTLDGTTPTTSSTAGFDGTTINITQNTTLKMFGLDAYGAASDVQTHQYTLGVQPPLTVYFQKPAAWANAKIHYWNSTPVGAATSTTWPGVNMTQNQPGCDWYYFTFPSEVDCINIVFNSGTGSQSADLNRCENGYFSGTSWTNTPPSGFCIANGPPVVTIDPLPVSCTIPTSLSITATDPDNNPVTICYTFDGTTPTLPTCQIWVPGTIPPSTGFTVKAIAFDNTQTPSQLVTQTYTSANNPPSHNIDPQGPLTFSASQNIHISATDDCSSTVFIYYTTDGSTPTVSSPSGVNNVYLFISQTTTIKYFVVDPQGNASSVQTNIFTYDQNFGCGNSGTGDFFTWDNATVYFTVTDRFKDGNQSNNSNYGRTTDQVGGFHGGDIVGLTQKISEGYFDSLGIDALWITPPVEQIHGHVPAWGNVAEFQKHYGYHGYYALDWTEMDANFGTKDQFRALVDSAHVHGIRVIMDVVMNHAGYDTPEDMTEFGWSSCTNWWSSQWIRKNDIASCAPCGGGDLTSCLAGLPDIISESTVNVSLPPVLLTKWDAAKETEEIAELNTFFNSNNLPRTPINHIVKWLTDWVKEFGIDGFRLDTYKHIEIQHWGTLKTEAQKALQAWRLANPNKKLDNRPFWMVGENYGSGITRWNDAVTLGKTDALINFNFQGQGGNFTTIDNIYNSYASVANPDPTWNFLSYISSHDTQLSNRNNLINEGSTFLMLPGAIQIFYGDETKRLAGPGPGDQPTRSDMNWNSIDQGVLSHWQKLGRFRQKHPAIGAGSHSKINSTPYTFRRSLNNSEAQDEVIIVFGGTGNVTINVSNIPTWTNGTVLRNYYTGATAIVSGGSVTFNAGANGVILIENPNPVVIPNISASPENNSFSTTGHTICLSGNSLDCNPVTVYYTFDLAASENNLASWTVYSGCFSINENKSLKALAVNNANGLKSSIITLNYYVSLPDMTIYYKNDAGYTNVNLYHWNTLPASAMNSSTAWPGKPMTLLCNNNTPSVSTDDWYILTLPASLTTNLIFNCGNNTCQTPNLSTGGTKSFYENGVWSSIPPSSFCLDCSMVSNTNNTGNGSLRYAIGCAVDGSNIQFTAGLNNQTIQITSPIVIDKNINIISNSNITVDGSTVIGSVFTLNPQKQLSIKGLNIKCGLGPEGKCMMNSGKLTLDNVNMIDGASSQGGNSIKNLGQGTININNNVNLTKN